MKNKQILKFYKYQLKTNYFNNGLRSSSVLFDRRHNNLRVMSTPEFPVPYYQRISRALPATEELHLNINPLFRPVCDADVCVVKSELQKTSEGIKVLDYIENKVNLNSYKTKITSVGVQSNIYCDDLINYIDASNEENHRILKTVDLSDALRV